MAAPFWSSEGGGCGSRQNFASLSLLAAASSWRCRPMLPIRSCSDEPVAVAYPDWCRLLRRGNVGVGGFGTDVTDLSDDMFDEVGAEMNLFGTAAIVGGQFATVSWKDVMSSASRATSSGHRSTRACYRRHGPSSRSRMELVRDAEARAGIADENSLFYMADSLAEATARRGTAGRSSTRGARSCGWRPALRRARRGRPPGGHRRRERGPASRAKLTR